MVAGGEQALGGARLAFEQGQHLAERRAGQVVLGGRREPGVAGVVVVYAQHRLPVVQAALDEDRRRFRWQHTWTRNIVRADLDDAIGLVRGLGRHPPPPPGGVQVGDAGIVEHALDLAHFGVLRPEQESPVLVDHRCGTAPARAGSTLGTPRLPAP